MSKILVIEDEQKIVRIIELELLHEGYDVYKAYDGRQGVEMACAEDFDLILLDVMLPQLNGLEVLRRIRRKSNVPVILLTARDAVMDKVAGLDAGADDYVTKPFSIEELLARVRLALRHGAARQASRTATTQDIPRADTVSHTGDADNACAVQQNAVHLIEGPFEVVLDTESYEVRVQGELVELTNREFELLRALLQNKNRVLTRSQLMELAWGYEFAGSTNLVDVHIHNLRAKIDGRCGAQVITTVREVGYVIRDS